jgi:hypothetical protein
LEIKSTGFKVQKKFSGGSGTRLVAKESYGLACEKKIYNINCRDCGIPYVLEIKSTVLRFRKYIVVDLEPDQLQKKIMVSPVRKKIYNINCRVQMDCGIP